jgi:hypothetical protein
MWVHTSHLLIHSFQTLNVTFLFEVFPIRGKCRPKQQQDLEGLFVLVLMLTQPSDHGLTDGVLFRL